MRIKGKVRRFRKVVRSLLGTDVRVRPTLAVPTMTLGNAHAEWTFCPTGLDESSVVYSVGIGEDVSFDTALIERFGVAVYAFDPTPRSLAWIERQTLPDKLHVVPVGLAGQDGTISVHAPLNPDHVSHSVFATGGGDRVEVPVKRLVTLMEELGHTRVDLLKMDIEGAEYDVIEDLADSKVEVAQLLVEFHHFMDSVPVDLTKRALATLQALGFELIAVSEGGYEYSFLRRK